MSTGLELIPIGIALTGLLAQSLKERMNNPESSVSEGDIFSVQTRITDFDLLREALDQSRFNFDDGPGELQVTDGITSVTFSAASNSTTWASFSPTDRETSLAIIESIETSYARQLQTNVVAELLQNAEIMGMTASTENSSDGVIRMRVMIS